MSVLVLCQACNRHFRRHEPWCPFCGADVGAAIRRPPLALSPDASRSRRYAASVAFVAGGAALACGQTSGAEPGPDASGGSAAQSGAYADGGSSGERTGGGTSAGGVAGSLAVGGTSVGTGGATGGTTAGTGGTDTRAGAGGSAGKLVEGERACPGYPERMGCRTAQDCPPGPRGLSFECAMTPPPGCEPSYAPSLCPVEGCPSGSQCRSLHPCGPKTCVEDCTTETCNGTCVNGTCMPRPCDEPGAPPCPDGFTCDPGASTRDHCVAIACIDGFECEPWKTCAPNQPRRDEHGCTAVACSRDSDCGDCGYCVNGTCEATLGLCYYYQLAMPYGCVWPDEELV